MYEKVYNFDRQTDRLIAIDFVKGIAIGIIILVHYNQSFENNFPIFRFGQMGCQMFFVISGFGSSLSYFRKRKSISTHDAAKYYYIARFYAIAPPWYFMMVVVFLINSLLLLMTGKTLSFGTNRNPVAILCNVLFLHGVLPFCNNNVMPGGWYIGTLILLYLILPLLYSQIEGRPPKIRIIKCLFLSICSLIVLILLGMIFPGYTDRLFSNNSFGYFSILTQFPCFIFGVLLFFDYQDGTFVNKSSLKAVLGSTVLLSSIILFFNPIFELSFIIDVTLVGIAVYLLLAWIFTKESKLYNAKYINFVVNLGKMSYFLYLVHFFWTWPFVRIVKRMIDFLGLSSDTCILFWLLIPIVFIFSYRSACLLKTAVNNVTVHLSCKTGVRSDPGTRKQKG